MSATQQSRRDVFFLTWRVDRERATQLPICLFAFALVLLGPAVPGAQAEPLLLAEFTHDPNPRFYAFSPPATVPFDFIGGTSGMGAFLFWEDDYGPSDVGMTFLAPQDIVDDANLSIMLPNTVFHLTSGPANPSDPLRLPHSCGANSCLLTFVSDITRYRITLVERIIDQLVQAPLIEGHTLDAAQRIRFLGELIPEPCTIGMLLIGIGHCALLAVRRRHRSG